MGVGRPKRVDNGDDIARLKRQGKALRQYRESEKCAIWVLGDNRFDDGRRHPYPSREELAKQLNIARATLQRYEEGKLSLPDDIAFTIENYTGIVCQYWQGYISQPMTKAEYVSYKISEDAQARETWEEISAAGPYFEDCIKERKQFFSYIGFAYEYTPATAAQDFGEVPFYGSHTLIRQNNPIQKCHFTDTELDALIEKLQSTVGFACYEKEREG